ncbi:potassium channel family protein [Solibacillus sp. FSL H8-0538]|uniref:potassium channel family protein n=1 Tax=Solibacillus sp. FSL H8-0538 TaxID=2921400 RepID=UPI0030F94408
MSRTFAVIGFGRFGRSVAYKLARAGEQVMILDQRAELIQEVEQDFTQAYIADATDERVLKSLDITSFDCVILAIGHDIQASILTAMSLKNFGARSIIAKALDERHGQVLQNIGVDWIVYPEKDMGERVGNQILNPRLLNYIELSDKISIEEITVPTRMIGHTIKQIGIRAKYDVTILAVIRNGDILVSNIIDLPLAEDDLIVILGSIEALRSIQKV